MRKKLLIAENANMFAELERNNTENKTLKIRLTEQTETAKLLSEKLNSLTAENEELKNKLAYAYDEIEKLKTINRKSQPASPEIQNNLNVKREELSDCRDGEEPLAEQPSEQKAEEGLTDCRIKEVINEISAYESCEIPKKEPLPKISEEQRNALKKLGAAEIGRVTKTAAYISASLLSNPDENTEKLYSLALGKNEGFKIKVLSIVSGEGEFEKLSGEIKSAADNTVRELNSILKSDN